MRQVVGAKAAACLPAFVPAAPEYYLVSLPDDLFSILLGLGFLKRFEDSQDTVTISDSRNAHFLEVFIRHSVGDAPIDLVFLKEFGVVSDAILGLDISGDLRRGPLRKILVSEAVAIHGSMHLVNIDDILQ